MSRKKYILYLVAGWIIGLFILPSVFGWFGMPYPFANLLYWVFGEPNTMKISILSIFTVLILVLYGRSIHKEFKELT